MNTKERQTAHLDSVVDDGLDELDSLFRQVRDPRSPGGRSGTETEMEQLEAAWKRFRPRAEEATTTLAFIRTAATSHHGVRSEWFRRLFKSLDFTGRESLT